MVDETRDRLAAMEKRLEEGQPEAFIFDEEHAQFAGWFKRLKRGPSKFGMTPLAILEDATTGELRSIWMHHTVLRNQMIEAAPQPGELVLIRYLGREPLPVESAGTDYANYRVVVDRPEGAGGMSWDDLEVERPRPASEEPVYEGGEDIPF